MYRKNCKITSEEMYEEVCAMLGSYKPTARNAIDYVQFLELKDAVEQYEIERKLKEGSNEVL